MLKQQLVEAVMKRIYYLLNEGRNADKAKQKTLEVIRKFFNNASWLDNEFVDAAANPNHLSVIDYIEHKLKELCFHANIPDSVIRLEPIIMNIALSLGFEQQNQDTTKLNRLFRIVSYITKCITEKLPLPEPLKQLNELTLENTTYDRLNDLFGSVLDKQDAAESERINNADYSEGMNTAYEILSDIDYDTAHYYGNYSCSNSKLCYTQSESTWNQYTNSGSNTVYLLLRKDWQKIPEEHGENTPYDDYGLSMIFVFIDGEGNIAYSNTRWNHRTNGQGPSNVDQSFTKEYLSQLLNVNFGSVFKSLHSFAEKVAKVKQQLQNGADPKDVFDWVDNFSEGFALVQLGYKWNFINTDGNLLRDDLWFDVAWDFHEGFAGVKLNDKWNFINTDGNLLRDDLWFDVAWGFYEGFARVKLNDKWNFINTDGNLLSDDLWFEDAGNFSKGFAWVILNDKWNFINTDGRLLRDDLWFDRVSKFSEGFAMVKLNGKWYYIDTKGNLYDEDKNLINKVTENKRRVAHLTESQLRNTIKNVITQYLNESRRQ